MVFARVCASAWLCAAAAGMAYAQPPQAPPPAQAAGAEDAAGLARGWSLLSQGSLPAASRQAGDALRRNPRSVGALTLAVEVALAQQGTGPALDLYASWLGARTLEEAGVLRRLARAVLHDASRGPGLRVMANERLAEDGDDAALNGMRAASRQGSSTETRLLAAMGDREAAQRLGTMLQQGRVDQVSALAALGDSGDTRALPGVTAQAADLKPEVRGAAAEALGKLGANAPGVRESLLRLLSDESPHVRTRAAAALYRLGDSAGTPLLRELAASEVPIGRMVAAEAMASRPDAAWMALVGELAQSGAEPEVRLGAAKLIAPHDPALAQSVAREYERHDNVALREMSVQVMCEAATDDSLGALRQLLRSGDERTRLRAADRIPTLTR